ncbi:AMIN domain-containing protein [Thermodesulfobacteriota bacterium]
MYSVFNFSIPDSRARDSRSMAPIFLAENNGQSPGNPKAPGKITTIKIKILYSGEEKVLISGNGISPPKIFALEGEKPRVVCDFKGVGLGPDVEKKIEVDGKFIKMIRTAAYENEGGKVRVVLDLSPEGSYEVEQTFFKKQNIYELIVKPEKAIFP